MKPLPPKPFCINSQNVKAFVLGCDPTAFDTNGNRLEFEYVFDLGKGQRYFSSILKNLNTLGLTLHDIYVQNLITHYQEIETSKNKNWFIEAKKCLRLRKEEFDEKDPEGKIPVLLTSEYLYKVLINEEIKVNKPNSLYNLEVQIPVPPVSNSLDRPLIPLYRHRTYTLVNWPVYTETLIRLFR